MSPRALRTLATGLIAGATSTVALMLCGLAERTTAAGPLNGPSQWIWGRRAAHSRRWSWRTAVGSIIHHASAIGWAYAHVRTLGRDPASHSPAGIATRAAATATLAATVDYGLTPRRLQPGFEAQLSVASLVVVYAAFAAGLALSDAAFGAAARRARH